MKQYMKIGWLDAQRVVGIQILQDRYELKVCPTDAWSPGMC